ncbi:mechanosensitive ion channel protein MscS [Halobellus salinus]|uniref:Mechanosensitive ion channel protein MscS n=1 Tax=Halobellus salinus TaxID=931585 RepID=A0A830ER70_9EURY|nr:mechanosensitive ion channel domain-containing protein [Halobellus salinus]GGJ15861.1 mechanosensitive ion channel protein MscS [Halobellus salinus]SMP30230.1 Conserved TM helix [Halobellus salinus]
MTETVVAAGSDATGIAQIDTRPLVDLFDAVPRAVWLGAIVAVAGVILAILLGGLTRRLLVRLGVPHAVEGTAFERTAREFGSSTVDVLGSLIRLFVLGVTFFGVLAIGNVAVASGFWGRTVQFLPQLFFALLILIVGVVVGDKVQMVISERLTGIKLPETGVFPRLAKFTVFYIAVLIALSQLGVATLALVVLLAGYLFAVVFLGGLALSDLLKSAASGSYLLLEQPYAIGDEVVIGDHRGIVQEVNLFVTHVEDDGEEFILPNSTVFETGVVRVRE